jgi:hypothetical protein
MTTFMSRKNPVSFIHQDMKRHAYSQQKDSTAAGRPPRRR